MKRWRQKIDMDELITEVLGVDIKVKTDKNNVRILSIGNIAGHISSSISHYQDGIYDPKKIEVSLECLDYSLEIKEGDDYDV